MSFFKKDKLHIHFYSYVGCFCVDETFINEMLIQIDSSLNG